MLAGWRPEPSPGGFVGKGKALNFRVNLGKMFVCLSFGSQACLELTGPWLLWNGCCVSEWLEKWWSVCLCASPHCRVWSQMPVSSSLSLFGLHNSLQDHFFSYICLVFVSFVSALLVRRGTNICLYATHFNRFLNHLLRFAIYRRLDLKIIYLIRVNERKSWFYIKSCKFNISSVCLLVRRDIYVSGEGFFSSTHQQAYNSDK